MHPYELSRNPCDNGNARIKFNHGSPTRRSNNWPRSVSTPKWRPLATVNARNTPPYALSGDDLMIDCGGWR